MRYTKWFAALALAAISITAQTTNNNSPADPIIGTWAIKVPGPTPEETFYAIQTFHQGGTFTENSSLLPNLKEGPTQGAWERAGKDYKLTFVLFRYNDEGEFEGYVRVRCTLKLTNDRLDADTIVDLIELDGEVIEAVAVGPYFGLRQKVTDMSPIASVPTTSSLSGEARGGSSAKSVGQASAQGSRNSRSAARRWSGLVR